MTLKNEYVFYIWPLLFFLFYQNIIAKKYKILILTVNL